ncbi:MAG TPA: protein-L-isoaspartate O-methyltransferase [Aeromicrobium sp.]|nr:protein-L-isoaspartate O-methyltransferase [Aeromicrobium sp.]
MGDERLRDAFAVVARSDFLRPEDRRFAETDAPLGIGWGQTNSQPRTVFAMFELLDVQPGQRVLDVGSGSGWTTALLAHLVGSGGLVVGVELEPHLVEFGAANLAKYDYPCATIRQSPPDVLGAPDEAPFDRILVSAEAPTLPPALVAQLGVGGVLVIPVKSRMTRVVRVGSGLDDITVSTHGLYSFVPLR